MGSYILFTFGFALNTGYEIPVSVYSTFDTMQPFYPTSLNSIQIKIILKVQITKLPVVVITHIIINQFRAQNIQFGKLFPHNIF